MDIVIPTYGRALQQETLRQLVDAGLEPTLVVQPRDYLANQDTYFRYTNGGAHLYVLPESITTIAPTRQYIIDRVGKSDVVIMVDDDLTFYHRREDDRTKLRTISPAELFRGFHDLACAISADLPHAGFASREGANRCTDDTLPNTRIMRVLGYHRPTLQQLATERGDGSAGPRFGDLEVMEDFHIALSLLERGYPNMILNEYAHNQAGSGKAGGCSHFRTPELQARNAHRLAELHPGFVNVVQKETKTAWGGGTRTDVTVYWKKAYEAGRKRSRA